MDFTIFRGAWLDGIEMSIFSRVVQVGRSTIITITGAVWTGAVFISGFLTGSWGRPESGIPTVEENPA